MAIEGQSLQTDCFPHVHLSSDRGERIIKSVVDFL